jgi:hypothetical protein
LFESRGIVLFFNFLSKSPFAVLDQPLREASLRRDNVCMDSAAFSGLTGKKRRDPNTSKLGNIRRQRPGHFVCLPQRSPASNRLLMATIDDLPDEVLLAVVFSLGVRGICALSMTCQRMRAITTDSCRWRSLFVRHFAHLYEHIDPTTVPSSSWLAPETWPPEAHCLYALSGAASLMPPPCEPVTGLPAPFAHAFAMGKDWRWMYRTHAVNHSNRLANGPGRKKMRHDMCAGDYQKGGLIYGVNVTLDGSYWEEAYTPWQLETQWRIECTPEFVSCFVRDFSICHWPASGRREWTFYSRCAIDSVAEWAGARKVVVVGDARGYRSEPKF